MRNCKCNGWKLLATAIIKQGFCEYDKAFINGDWIQNLYILSGGNERDYIDLLEIGQITKQINELNIKIKYYKNIGKNYDILFKKKKELQEQRKNIKKHNIVLTKKIKGI